VPTDWLEVLKEQAEIARRMAAIVPETLAHPDLTIDQAQRVCRLVEDAAQDLDRITAMMASQDLDVTLYDLADSLEDIWSDLSLAAVNRLRELQGLEPLEFPDDADEKDE
jgi:hypothetical protein